MIERSNTNVALDALFEEVENMIADAKRIPLTEKVMMDADDLAGALDEIKSAIPKEIKSATQVLEEQKSIVNKAYEEAERIVQHAKDEADRIVGVAQAEADRMVQEEEVVKQANAFAEEIKANALRYQEESKAAADDYALRVKQDSLQYADDMLAFLGQNLQSALQGLDDNRTSVGNEMRNIANPAAPVAHEHDEDDEA